MGWELINGDPAPGSPLAIQAAERSLSGVSTLASEAMQTLNRSTSQLGTDRWRGTAAALFRENLHELPGKLNDVAVSYEEAASALRGFRRTLESARQESAGTLALAQQAWDDIQRDDRHRRDAQSLVNSLYGRENNASARLTLARRQAVLALDPASHATAQAAAQMALDTLNRYRADRQLAEATRNRYAGAVAQAEERLARCVQRAGVIRAQMLTAVRTSIGLLQRAERDAHLPNRAQRALEELREGTITYGPVIVDSLNVGVTLFNIAALVFPPGVAVFKTGAIVCGAGALLASFTVAIATPGGLSNDKILHLGVETLALAASVAGLSAATKAGQAAVAAQAMRGALTAKAASAATTARWLDLSADVGTVGEGYSQHGMQGGLLAVGGLVVGKAVDKVGGTVVRAGLTNANRNPRLRKTLEQMSRAVAGSKSVVKIKIPVVDVEIPLVSTFDARCSQSLLATGRIPPGGSLPDHQQDHLERLLDHAIPGRDLRDRQDELGGAIPNALIDQAKAKIVDHLDVQHQEIDINLPRPSRQ